MYIRHQSVTVAVIGCISLGLASVGFHGSLVKTTPATLLYSDAAPEPPRGDAPDDSSGAGTRGGPRVMQPDVYLDPLAAAWRDLRSLILLSDRLSPR